MVRRCACSSRRPGGALCLPGIPFVAAVAAVFFCRNVHALPATAATLSKASPQPFSPSLHKDIGGMATSRLYPSSGSLMSETMRLRGGSSPLGRTPFEAINKLTLGQQNLIGVLAVCFFVFSEVFSGQDGRRASV
jgi:hypothetical protein